jgi:hypothetical protein
MQHKMVAVPTLLEPRSVSGRTGELTGIERVTCLRTVRSYASTRQFASRRKFSSKPVSCFVYVLNEYCHRVTTQLQLINIINIIINLGSLLRASYYNIQGVYKRMVRFQKLTINLFLTLNGQNVHRQQRQLSKFFYA